MAGEPQFLRQAAQVAGGTVDLFQREPGAQLELVMMQGETGDPPEGATEMKGRHAQPARQFPDRAAGQRVTRDLGPGRFDHFPERGGPLGLRTPARQDRALQRGPDQQHHLLLQLELVDRPLNRPGEQDSLLEIQFGARGSEGDREGTRGVRRRLGIESGALRAKTELFRAWALFDLGRRDEAVAAATAAAASPDPDDRARATLLLGQDKLDKGRFAEALPVLRTATGLGDKGLRAEAHFRVAQALFKLGQKEEALREADSAISLDPVDPKYPQFKAAILEGRDLPIGPPETGDSSAP